MTSPDSIAVLVERDIDASCEAVFDAWLDPALAARFLFATDAGAVVRCDIDARVGGTFTVVDRRADGDAAHFGVWLALERPRHLAFAFSLEGHDPGAERVTVDITPRGDGCTVVLVHAMDARWRDWTDRTRGGWTSMLDALDRALANGGPR